MEKDELRALLSTLTEKEINYQENPKHRETIFETQFDEGFPVFDLTNSLYQNKFFPNDESRSFFTYSDIEFVQHTRFSHPPLHKHGHIELTYIYQGSCKQQIEGKTITLHQGDLCLLDSNVVHTIFEANEKDIVINMMMKKAFFNDAFLNRLAKFSSIPGFILQALSEEKTKNNFMIFHPKNKEKINGIVENMLLEYIKNDAYSEETIQSYLIIFFTELIRNHELTKEKSASEVSNVLSILKFIETNYLDVDRKTLAETFNYHPNYIASLLKEHTGRTFKEIVIDHKMTKAKFLLTNTTLSVDEIAESIGYHNLTFFYKKFKEIVGVTPQQYRKNSGIS